MNLPGHMIATLLQLNHSLAVEAAFPTRLFRYSLKLSGVFIHGAMPRLMPLVVA